MIRAAFAQHRLRADEVDGRGARDVRVRRHDDLIAGADTRCEQTQLQRIGAVRDPDGMFHTEERTQIRFELREVLLQDVGAAAHHVAQQCHQLLLVRGEQRRVVEERDLSLGPHAGGS